MAVRVRHLIHTRVLVIAGYALVATAVTSPIDSLAFSVPIVLVIGGLGGVHAMFGFEQKPDPAATMQRAVRRHVMAFLRANPGGTVEDTVRDTPFPLDELQQALAYLYLEGYVEVAWDGEFVMRYTATDKEL